MFSGYSRVDNNNYDLKEAWQKCIELSAVGKEAVILYSERFGSVTGIAAFASTRRIVEDCGRKFDKEIKCLEKDGTRVDYHTIIELAKKFRF